MTNRSFGKLPRRKRKKIITGLAEDLSSVEMLNLFIDILPAIERKVLKLHFWEKMNFQKVAQKLNLRTSTVAMIYRKALRRLRQKKSVAQHSDTKTIKYSGIEIDIFIPRSSKIAPKIKRFFVERKRL